MGFNAPVDRPWYEKGLALQTRQLFQKAADFVLGANDLPAPQQPISLGVKAAAAAVVIAGVIGTYPEGAGRAAGQLTAGFKRASEGLDACRSAPVDCPFLTQAGGFLGSLPHRVLTAYEDGLRQ